MSIKCILRSAIRIARREWSILGDRAERRYIVSAQYIQVRTPPCLCQLLCNVCASVGGHLRASARCTAELGVRRNRESVIDGVKTHCLLRAAASLMRDEDKGSEGGRC